MPATLPTAIRHARLERGLSQRELAERIGMTQPAICHIERGRSCPTLSHFTALVRTLELDAAAVLR